MSQANTLATFIIPAGIVTSVRNKCKTATKADGTPLPGIDGMFTAELNRTNDAAAAPATHYISSGWMSQDEIDWLNANIPPAFEFVLDDTDPRRTIAAKGLKLRQPSL